MIIFLCSSFLSVFFFFSDGPIEYKYILNRFIWPIDRTLTGTTTPEQRGPWSNGSKGVLHTPLELQMPSLIIKYSYLSYPRQPFRGEVLPLCKAYSQHIQSPIDQVCLLLGWCLTPLQGRDNTPPTSVLDITLNNLMVRFQ